MRPRLGAPASVDLTGAAARDLLVTALLAAGYRSARLHGEIARLEAQTRPLGFLLDSDALLVRGLKHATGVRAARYLTQSHRLYVAPLGEHEGGQALVLEPHDDSRDIGALAVTDLLSLAIPRLPATVEVVVHDWRDSATPLHLEVDVPSLRRRRPRG